MRSLRSLRAVDDFWSSLRGAGDSPSSLRGAGDFLSSLRGGNDSLSCLSEVILCSSAFVFPFGTVCLKQCSHFCGRLEAWVVLSLHRPVRKAFLKSQESCCGLSPRAMVEHQSTVIIHCRPFARTASSPAPTAAPSQGKARSLCGRQACGVENVLFQPQGRP